MRGRTLRLDPADPEKVASNWDVVCVAPDLVRGTADYERFVRKHLHLFAPAEDGEVEAGPSHVHPEMGPFAPPPVGRFAALNAAQLERATDRAAARELWQVGTPYRGVELPTLLVRPSRAGRAARRRSTAARRARSSSRSGSRSRAASAARRRSRRSGWRPARRSSWPASRSPRSASAGPRSACAPSKKRLPLVLPLDAAARAVAEAYRELGELSPEAAGSLTIEPRAAGYLRCELTKATPVEGQKFAAALDELVGVSDAPRYLVSRPLADPAPRRVRPARPGADAARAVRRAPAPRAEGPGAQQGARGGLRARLGPPRRARAGSSSRSAARKAARRAPRRRPPTAATRRWSGTSGSERSASWAASSRSWAAR